MRAQRDEFRLLIVLLLNLLMIAALVVIGLSAHSVAVLAAGLDYLADAAAIGVSVLAIVLARRPPTARHPAGYPRATAIAALVNVGWLAAINLGVIFAAADRLARGTARVHGLPVLIVSSIAAVVMLAGALILGGDPDDDDEDDEDEQDGGERDEGAELNRKAVLLDTAADSAAAAGVAISGGVILATGSYFWLDPAVALVIALIIGYHAVHLARRVIGRLRDTRRDRNSEPSTT